MFGEKVDAKHCLFTFGGCVSLATSCKGPRSRALLKICGHSVYSHFLRSLGEVRVR